MDHLAGERRPGHLRPEPLEDPSAKLARPAHLLHSGLDPICRFRGDQTLQGGSRSMELQPFWPYRDQPLRRSRTRLPCRRRALKTHPQDREVAPRRAWPIPPAWRRLSGLRGARGASVHPRHLGDTTSVTLPRSRTSANRCRSVAVGPRRPVHGSYRQPPRAAGRVASPPCLPRTGSFASCTTARARPGNGDATSRAGRRTEAGTGG